MWDFSPDQRLTPYPLHWKAVQPLDSQGSPQTTTDDLYPLPGPGLGHFCTEPLASPRTLTNVLFIIPDSTLMHRKLNWTPTLNFTDTEHFLQTQIMQKSIKKTVTTIRWQMTLRGIPHGTGLGHQMTPSLSNLSALVLSWTSTPSHYHALCQLLAAITHLHRSLFSRTLWPS